MHTSLALAVTLATAAAAPARLALLPLQPKNVSPEVMQQLDAAIRIELGRVRGVELVEAAEVQKYAGAGCHERGCLEAVARATRATEVLYGDARGLPDSFAVTLNLLDLASGKQKSAAASVNRDIEEMVWATRAQVSQLKAPQRFAGRLVLVVPAGAEARVSGKAVDSTPLVVQPGTYGVRIKTAQKEIESWVEVRFEQTAMVSAGAERGLLVTYSPWAPPEKVQFAQVGPPRELANLPEESLALVPLMTHKPEAPLSMPVESAPTKEPEKKEAVPAMALPPPPPPPVAAPAQAKVGGWPRWPGYAGLVAGVGLAVGGILEERQASAKFGQIEAMRQPDGFLPADRTVEAKALRDAGNAARSIGGALLATGGVLLIGGGAYLLLAPAPGGATAAVQGNF